MRHLAARNPKNSRPISYVPMREMYDCMTCVSAMVFNLTYEEAHDGLGGNLNPSRAEHEESTRMMNAFYILGERCGCGVLHHAQVISTVEGRRYWVGVKIDDPSNVLSQRLGHSIVVDEAGRVLDPNPQYGTFNSLAEWSAAMTLPHQISFVTEVFEFTL